MPSVDDFRSVREDDLVEVGRLFSGIHRTAARLFMEGWQAGRVEAWILRKGDIKGAFATVCQDDFVVCYAAFDMAHLDQAVIDVVDLWVMNALSVRGEKPLFYNLRGDNEALIARAHQRGFKQDTLGYELLCRKVPTVSPRLDVLSVREYEERYLGSYLTLLDAAFNPLLAREGGKPDAFWREKEALQNTLVEKSARGEFAALWHERDLAGLYYLKEDLIEMVAVAPDYQNKGFGRSLLAHAVGHILREGGYPAAYLYVVIANTAAMRIYLRFGFTVSGFYSENTYVGITL